MKFIVALLLFIPAAVFAGDPKYGPLAVPLVQDNAYLKKATAPDFWALASFYVPQYTGAACSAASMTMALNALLNARHARGDDDTNITQEELVSETYSFDWKGLVSEAGSNGKHGLTLEQLSSAATEALAHRKVKNFTVNATHVSDTGDKALSSFRAALMENEANPDDIMLIHFAQDAVTGSKGGPYAHISPVGAYDAKHKRVLIFDVDRKWYEPYWVPDDAVLKAMSVKTAAFGYGGYVVIGVSQQQP
jgi:hypothetical protein